MSEDNLNKLAPGSKHSVVLSRNIQWCDHITLPLIALNWLLIRAKITFQVVMNKNLNHSTPLKSSATTSIRTDTYSFTVSYWLINLQSQYGLIGLVPISRACMRACVYGGGGTCTITPVNDCVSAKYVLQHSVGIWCKETYENSHWSRCNLSVKCAILYEVQICLWRTTFASLTVYLLSF